MQPCGVCCKAAPLRCSKCAEGTDEQGNTTPTYYCSKTCQTQDFTTHKIVCKAVNLRKRVHRGAHFLQQLLYVWRSQLCEFEITSIEKVGDKVHLRENPGMDNYDGPLPEAPEIFIHPFPEAIFQEENDKNAVLSYKSGGDAFVLTFGLIEKVFEGVCVLSKNAYEIHHLTHGDLMRVQRHVKRELNPGLYQQYSLQLQVKNLQYDKSKGIYMIDPTGAQYGQYHPAMPLQAYSRFYRCPKTQFFQLPHGDGLRQNQEMVNGKLMMIPGVPQRPMGDFGDYRKMVLTYTASVAIICSVTLREERTEETIAAVLAAKQDDWKAGVEELLAVIREDVAAFVGWVRSEDGPKFEAVPVVGEPQPWVYRPGGGLAAGPAKALRERVTVFMYRRHHPLQ